MFVFARIGIAANGLAALRVRGGVTLNERVGVRDIHDTHLRSLDGGHATIEIACEGERRPVAEEYRQAEIHKLCEDSPTEIIYPPLKNCDCKTENRCGSPERHGGTKLKERRRKPDWHTCSGCAQYDAERAYCAYIQLPVGVLFICPLNAAVPGDDNTISS